jgi:SAM-dependent methyltransferase
MNYFNLIFSNKSILRIFQLEIFKKFKINGDIIEFGASDEIEKNFCNSKLKNCKITYSNINPSNKEFLNIDLQKKILTELKYDYIIVFNVLEHLLDPNLALRNLSKICKQNGKIIGSTPFLFRVHGAPKDYSRFTKDHLIELLKSSNFKDIEIIELGTGPFLACISLLRSYLKYLPIFYQLLVLSALVFDKLIKLFIKTDPKKIYPIGYIFFATNI